LALQAELFDGSFGSQASGAVFAGVSRDAGLRRLAKTAGRVLKKLQQPEIDENEKAREIDSLFKELGGWVGGNGKEAVRILKELSTDISQEQITKVLGRETAGRAALSVKRFLDRSDPDRLEYRLAALVGLSRTLLSVEERALFRVLSEQGGLEQGLQAVGGDVVRLGGQVRALIRLYRLLSGEQSLDGLGKDGMKQVVADINELGFFYIKVAQSLSNTAFVMSEEAAEQLKVFQEHVPPMPPEQVLQVIGEEFGREANELFLDFDPAHPIASGSIAPVYSARIRTWWGGTRPVVVKVQRPGLKDTLDWNRKLNRIFLAVAAVHWDPKAAQVLDIIRDQITGLEDQFEGELDFAAEARRMGRFRLFHWLTPGVRVPRAFKRYSTSRVLTMSELPGENVDELITKLNKMEAQGDTLASRLGRRNLLSRLLRVLLFQVIVLGEVHADLHPGNILATQRGGVGLIDWSQSFRTRGLILRPVIALVNLFLGRPRGFARAMAAMGSSGRKETRALVSEAETLFSKHGIESRTLRALWRAGGDEEPFSDESISKLGRAAAEFVKKARTEHGYQMAPRYAQVLRAGIPVLGSLTALVVKTSSEDLKRIALWKAAAFLPVGLALLTVRGLTRLPGFLVGILGRALSSCVGGIRSRLSGHARPGGMNLAAPPRDVRGVSLEELDFAAQASARLAGMADELADSRGMKASGMTGADFIGILRDAREQFGSENRLSAASPEALAAALSVQASLIRAMSALLPAEAPLKTGIRRALAVWDVFNQEMARVANESGTLDAIEADAALFANQVEASI